jgi:hypothetical protein
MQVEQEVWNFVNTANAEVAPHSRVRRHQIVLLTASPLLPVSGKGEILVRQVEALFAEQIEKVYLFLNFVL